MPNHILQFSPKYPNTKADGYPLYLQKNEIFTEIQKLIIVNLSNPSPHLGLSIFVDLSLQSQFSHIITHNHSASRHLTARTGPNLFSTIIMLVQNTQTHFLIITVHQCFIITLAFLYKNSF